MNKSRRERRKDNQRSKKPKRTTHDELCNQIALLNDDSPYQIIFNGRELMYGLRLSGKIWKKLYLTPFEQ